MKDISFLAAVSVSSLKPGFGVSQLLDSNTETYWQSDGSQPHYINFAFPKRTLISKICIYSDYKQDESYSPKLVSIRAGTSLDSLQEGLRGHRTSRLVAKKEMETNGWTEFEMGTGTTSFIKTFLIQIVVLLNHQNGKDTHVRRVKIMQSTDPMLEE
ncbi:Anaphase-promoting complex subunit 10 [Kappamyces sp. JEL0829]|nr:Anaphase-promoting complex subunit 10 [Kappamyces sp. JEL0829]